MSDDLEEKCGRLEAEVKALRSQLARERKDAERHAYEEGARLVERFAGAYPRTSSVLRIVALNLRMRKDEK